MEPQYNNRQSNRDFFCDKIVTENRRGTITLRMTCSYIPLCFIFYLPLSKSNLLLTFKMKKCFFIFFVFKIKTNKKILMLRTHKLWRIKAQTNWFWVDSVESLVTEKIWKHYKSFRFFLIHNIGFQTISFDTIVIWIFYGSILLEGLYVLKQILIVWQV